MIDGRGLGLRPGVGEIGAGAQDVVEAAIGPGAELQRVAAGVVEAFRWMIAGQAKNAVAGPEAVFRIVLARHQRGGEGVDVGAEIAGALLQPGAGLLDAGALRAAWNSPGLARWVPGQKLDRAA